MYLWRKYGDNNVNFMTQGGGGSEIGNAFTLDTFTNVKVPVWNYAGGLGMLYRDKRNYLESFQTYPYL